MSLDEYIKELTAKQQLALPYLANGYTNKQTAAIIGVHENTISNWRREDDYFRECEGALRDAIYREANRGFVGLAGRAQETLSDLLGEENPPAVRLKAASFIIERMQFT